MHRAQTESPDTSTYIGIPALAGENKFDRYKCFSTPAGTGAGRTDVNGDSWCRTGTTRDRGTHQSPADVEQAQAVSWRTR